MPNINDYPEVCERCGEKRTCDRDGLCHQCRVELAETSVESKFDRMAALLGAVKR